MEGIVILLLAACGLITVGFVLVALIDIAYWWANREGKK